MKKFIIAGVILLVLYVSYRSYRILTLDKGLDKMIGQGAIVLDVRTPAEFKTGHMEGAVNIPLSRLHAGTIPLDSSKTIITCCSHGLRSVKAVALLKERGFRKVYNGGAWADLEQTIKQGAK